MLTDEARAAKPPEATTFDLSYPGTIDQVRRMRADMATVAAAALPLTTWSCSRRSWPPTPSSTADRATRNGYSASGQCSTPVSTPGSRSSTKAARGGPTSTTTSTGADWRSCPPSPETATGVSKETPRAGWRGSASAGPGHDPAQVRPGRREHPRTDRRGHAHTWPACTQRCSARPRDRIFHPDLPPGTAHSDQRRRTHTWHQPERPAPRRRPPATRREQTLADAARMLSGSLAQHRRAAGLTQPQLAALAGVSVTTIGHAETGRLWQSRDFWELADKELNADGELLTRHDAYRVATATPPLPSSAKEIAIGLSAALPLPVLVETGPAVVVASDLSLCVTHHLGRRRDHDRIPTRHGTYDALARIGCAASRKLNPLQ